jgi:hypothetical protein
VELGNIFAVSISVMERSHPKLHKNQSTPSVLQKDEIQDLVFFKDSVWFALITNIDVENPPCRY